MQKINIEENDMVRFTEAVNDGLLALIVPEKPTALDRRYREHSTKVGQIAFSACTENVKLFNMFHLPAL